MNFPTNKIRQLWLPFLLLAIAVLAASWFLVVFVYPNNNPGNDPGLALPIQPTATSSSTPTPTGTYTPTPTNTIAPSTSTSTPAVICTHSANYWRLNPDLWMVENFVIGNLSFTKDEALDILELSDPDPTIRLLQQFFAAILNKVNGAGTDEIDLAIIRIGDWLIIHPPGDNLIDSEIEELESLILQLENFNTGLTGPGQCENEPATSTPAYSATPTATSTSTPAPVRTITLPTPTPTKSHSGRPKPTQPPPTDPPPPPTNTPQPQPTNTRVPPTPAPTIIVPTLSPPTPTPES